MRILPLLTRNYSNNNGTRMQTQFERSGNPINNSHHKYTGNVSADLAYASLVDENIANDLKSMNLIA